MVSTEDYYFPYEHVCVLCRNVRPGSTDCLFRRAVWRPGRALAAVFGVNAMATVTHVILKHPSVRYATAYWSFCSQPSLHQNEP